MIYYSNCKINLGLHILNKREDGFHNIETFFYPVKGLCDAIELLPLEGTETDPAGDVVFTASGLTVDSPVEKNLCVRACRLMRERYPIGAVRLHLHKRIPMGAGLGGGSANAAFVIRGLNDLFSLELPDSTLEELAAELGSDTAFFIRNVPALAGGRGEQLTPVDLSLAGYTLVLVKPEVHIPTAEAYAGVIPAIPVKPLPGIIRQPVETWKEELRNDFEPSVFRKFPILSRLKTRLYQKGTLYAAMSGSGSTVFGLFPPGKVDLSGFDQYFVYQEIAR